MSTAKFHRQDERYDLAFFRRSTRAEIEAGGRGYVAWSVFSTGHHTTDFERGKAIAEEAVGFVLEHPTHGNMGLISDMISDLHRQADDGHRSLVGGFGLRLGQLAVLGAAAFGLDAVRKAEARDAADLLAAGAVDEEAP